MTTLWLLLVAMLAQLPAEARVDAGQLFDGKTWEQFLNGVSAQRDLWIGIESTVTVAPELVELLQVLSTQPPA